jgi:hypothetical protein
MAMTKETFAYVAGLIDGEGCIDIHYNKPSKTSPYGQYFVRIGIHMTNKEALEWLKVRWGGSITTRRSQYHRHPNWKQGYDWKLTSSAAIDLLRDIEPYMIIKKAEALIALKFRFGKMGTRLNPEIWEERILLQRQLQELKDWGRRFTWLRQ